MNEEEKRLQESKERKKHWKRWGPYVSERAWGTVREDYSADGAAWEYFPHDHARSRAYRWNEDGIAGICDRHQIICFAVSFWNGKDPILKERMFGLSNSEGSHGEDVKEYYYYIDSTPTHSYMKYLYKYPQSEYPYLKLLENNRGRDKQLGEYELIDTGVFDDDRYFDCFVEYAKDDFEDILIKIEIFNRGPDPAPITVLPTLWFRNTWSWDRKNAKIPVLKGFPRIDSLFQEDDVIHSSLFSNDNNNNNNNNNNDDNDNNDNNKSNNDSKNGVKNKEEGNGNGEKRVCTIIAEEEYYGKRYLYCEGAEELLFTENNTNKRKLFGVENDSKYVKDAFNEYIIKGNSEAVNPVLLGTKAAARYSFLIPPSQSKIIRLRFTNRSPSPQQISPPPSSFERSLYSSLPPLPNPFQSFDEILSLRLQECSEFYSKIGNGINSEDSLAIQRQAFAGMMWSKQYYHYVIKDWLQGDVAEPSPPVERNFGRNSDWPYLYNADVISMPDKWEYPWYAAWDLAFHMIPIALIDPDFAKEQLTLMLREWYMHPNGQIPAYEWAFSDVNPPVHAWAAMRVYQIEKKHYLNQHCFRTPDLKESKEGIDKSSEGFKGKCKSERQLEGGDRTFLARIFQKLLLNFTWWVNRKDADGYNVFEGGFLGLDNIGVFDRSKPLPTGGRLAQSDATSWMAMYCLNMLNIALELARFDNTYEDVASKFWEHFIYIAKAMNNLGSEHISMWDDEDGFYYDFLHFSSPSHCQPCSNMPLKVRSMVGLIPLYAIGSIDDELLNELPNFKKRMDWFIKYRPDLTVNVACMKTIGRHHRHLFSVVGRERLERVLKYLLDEKEFLSPYGIRALSQYHKDHPYILHVNGEVYRVDYDPAESQSSLFGGNSNWRGPIWFPVNYLLIEALQRYYHYFGDDVKVECPTGSGKFMNLWEISGEISRRLMAIFQKSEDGTRPVYGTSQKFQKDKYFRDWILFYEYFNGDTGEGVGASHQTGWTGLVAKLILQSALYDRCP